MLIPAPKMKCALSRVECQLRDIKRTSKGLDMLINPRADTALLQVWADGELAEMIDSRLPIPLTQ